MENPYERVPPDVRNVRPDEHHDDYLRRMVEGSRHDAWNEGSASRDPEVSKHHVVIKNLRAALVAEHKKLTEQAEILSGYREALEWIAAGKAGRTTPAACMAATVTRAKAALAKATQ